MKSIQRLAMLLFCLVKAVGAIAQGCGTEKPTIVFVQGIWADGSCCASQIAAQEAEGCLCFPYKIR